MLPILFIIIALLSGAAVAMQTGVNSQLRVYLNNPLQAGLISFAVGTLVLAIVALPQGTRWNFGEMINFPWWVWIGGLLGAFFVISAILIVPRFGAATYLVLNLIGQMITALILDHYGLLGFPVQRISFLRALGVVFLVIGVMMIRRF
jgi:transporter family-2 protein